MLIESEDIKRYLEEEIKVIDNIVHIPHTANYDYVAGNRIGFDKVLKKIVKLEQYNEKKICLLCNGDRTGIFKMDGINPQFRICPYCRGKGYVTKDGGTYG